MSIPNRTVSITGVFAEDAATTIPETPVSGVSYRNTAMTGTVMREGWAYKTIVDSSNFNQALYEYSSLTKQLETYGFLPWSNLTDYVQGSLCLGSDGVIYQAKQATGPSSTAYDPTSDTNHTYWEDFVGNTYVTKSTAQSISGSKTFTGNTSFTGTVAFSSAPYSYNRIALSAVNSNYTIGSIPANVTDSLVTFNDANGTPIAYMQNYIMTDGSTNLFFQCRNKDNSNNDVVASLGMCVRKDGLIFLTGNTDLIARQAMPKFESGVSAGSGYQTQYACAVLVQAIWNGSSSYLTSPFNATLAATTYNGNTNFRNDLFFLCDDGVTITFSNAYCTIYPLKGV